MNRRILTRLRAILFVLAAALLGRGVDHAAMATTRTAGDPLAGVWSAGLTCPGGEIEFDLELQATNGTWTAAVRNGDERVAVPAVHVDAGTIRIEFTHYGSTLSATVAADGRTMRGEWTRRRGSDLWTQMPFQARWRARVDSAPTTTPAPATTEPSPAAASPFAGRWRVSFSSSSEPAVGVFAARPGGELTGTFLTTVGDYRFLGGRTEADGQRMRLHVFDGAHAFLFTAERQPDGSLAGDFWSRDAWHETWTAVRDDAAALPDGFGLTAWNADADLSALRFPTPDGELVALDDARFAGRPLIIDIFGTWCPNCNDATELLVDLHRRHAADGLQILGLAFEYTGDPAIDAARVTAYREHHGIEFPILIAGTADKAQASAALPIIDRVRAYPTLIFMDRDGTVRAIYTGFNGPATGPLHQKLLDDVDRLVADILAAP